MTKKKKKTIAVVRRTLDMQELARAIIEANEERQRVKDLTLQLQDDIMGLHLRLETMHQQIVGLTRRDGLV